MRTPPHLSVLCALVFLTASPVWADFSSVERGGTSTRCAPAVSPDGLGEDVLAFCDREHEYNDIPAALAGLPYVIVSNSDKTQADYSLAVTLDTDGVILIFLDNRIPDGDNLTPAAPGGGVMDWVVTMGFTDTGFDIGVDESGDGIINQTSSVYQLAVDAGETVLLQQDNTGGRNMYGVACASELFGQAQVPASTPTGLILGICLLLVAGIFVLRRRAAAAL